MNNQARSCKLKCKYNVQGICHAYGECIAKDLFIEELEIIKGKITMKSRPQWERLVVNLTDCEIIINDIIAELKGE